LNRRMPNGTYWWCERGIKFPLLDLSFRGMIKKSGVIFTGDVLLLYP